MVKRMNQVAPTEKGTTRLIFSPIARVIYYNALRGYFPLGRMEFQDGSPYPLDDVWVNGDLVNHGSKCTATTGQIALQAEGSEVEFRKLDLAPITKLTE